MELVTRRILDFNKKRNPFFLSLKYRSLTESPFRFLRGTCHLFYEDLAKHQPLRDPTRCWICGDLHLENFGTFKAENSLVYFDLNDFDEAILAPSTWELLRALTSIYLAVDGLGKKKGMADELAADFLDTFTRDLLNGKSVAFERDTTNGLVRQFITTVGKRKPAEILENRVLFKGKKARLAIRQGATVAVKNDEKNAILNFVKKWCEKNRRKNWLPCDVAYRIAGTGSLGVNRYIVLVQDNRVKKHFLLDMKQAMPSSLLPFVKLKQPEWANEAERVVRVQYYAQNEVPAFLGTLEMRGSHYVIHRMQPTADRANLALYKDRMKKLGEVIDTFAGTSASAQLRSTGRMSSSTADELMAFYGKDTAGLKKKMLSYAKQYAKQVAGDYRAYVRDYRAGLTANKPNVNEQTKSKEAGAAGSNSLKKQKA